MTLRLVRVLLGWRELQALRDGKPFSRLTAPGMGRARITWSAFLFVGGTSLLAELGSRAGVGWLSGYGVGDRNGWIQAGLLTAFGLASRAGSLLAVLGGSGVLLWQQVDWV